MGILFNPFTIKEFLSSDHLLEKETSLIILCFEGISLLAGSIFYLKHKTIIEKRKEIILAISAFFISLFLLVVLFESVSRYLNLEIRSGEAAVGGNLPRNLVIPDKELGYTLNPSFNTTEVEMHGDFVVEVTINSEGYRDFERNLSSCNMFIFGLGDSFTYGEGVMLNETYLALLERYLNYNHTNPNNYSICIIKAGVPGYGIHQMARLYEKIQDIYNPKIVLLGYIEGDISRIQNGFVEFSGWTVAEAWLPVLQSCPNGYLTIKKKYFNDFHYSLYCHSYSYRFLMSRQITRSILNLLLPDDVPPPFSAERKSAEDYFLDMKDSAIQENITLIILPFCQENVSLSSFFNQNNITYYPIICESLWHFPHDKHWNAEGHKNVAEELSLLKELRNLQ